MSSELSMSEDEDGSRPLSGESMTRASCSPFLDLPPEIRNSIYEYALYTPNLRVGPIHPSFNPELRIHTLFYNGPPTAGRRLSLLRTCKQVRKEASNLFWSCNASTITCEEPVVYTVGPAASMWCIRSGQQLPKILNTLDDFVAKIGRKNAEAIPKLKILIRFQSHFVNAHHFAEMRKQLLDALRTLHSTHLERPYWHLSVDIKFWIGIEYGSQFEHDVEFEMEDPLNVLDHAVDSLHDHEADLRLEMDGRDVCSDYEKDYCVQFLGNLRDMMADISR